MNRPHGSDNKYAPRRQRSGSFKQHVRRLPPFLRIRRSRKATLVVVFAFLAFSYYTIAFFFRYSVYDGDERGSLNPLHDPRRFPPRGVRPSLWSYRPRFPPSDRKAGKDKDEEYTYDAQIRFPRLYHTISQGPPSGRYAHNRIVLFVAGNVESASKLAILACQMAKEQRNIVQFAFMMRDEMDLGQWAAMNNIGEGLGDCDVNLHDARLEYAGISTLRRSKQGLKAALAHFRNFMHPQVVMVDAEGEQEWWLEALKQGCKDVGIPSILLPGEFMGLANWFKKLDSGALRAWNDLKIHIMVRVGEHNGNLIRLLRSLAAADTFGLKKETFQLTIEIPRRIQPSFFTFEFLRGYSWPSRDRIRLKRPLTLASDSPDTVTAAIRFAEEWYPSDDKSYLLLLNENVEVSQFFWHWVWYNVLQHRHSFDLDSPDTDMYGMSFLSLPTDFFPSGKTPLPEDHQSQFLMTTPSANATLLFPNHFLHYRYYLSRLDQNLTTTFEKSSHFISKPADSPGTDPMRTPHFLRPLHTLAKARGWGMLYPSLPSLSHSEELPVYVRSHNNLPSIPRPYAQNKDEYQPKEILASSNFAGLSYLPAKGDLPKYEALRWIDEDTGNIMDYDRVTDVLPVEEAALRFRMSITGCYEDASNNGGWKDRIAAVWDLFCPVKSKEEIRKEQVAKEKDSANRKEQANLSGEGSVHPPLPQVKEEVGGKEIPTESEVEKVEEGKKRLEHAKDDSGKPPKPYNPWRNKLGQVEKGIVKDGMETPDEVQVAGRLFKVPKPGPVKVEPIEHKEAKEPATSAPEPLKPDQQEKLEQRLDLSAAGLLVETRKPPVPAGN